MCLPVCSLTSALPQLPAVLAHLSKSLSSANVPFIPSLTGSRASGPLSTSTPRRRACDILLTVLHKLQNQNSHFYFLSYPQRYFPPLIYDDIQTISSSC